MLKPVLLALHDHDGHVVSDFICLHIRECKVPLMMTLASCNANDCTNGVTCNGTIDDAGGITQC